MSKKGSGAMQKALCGVGLLAFSAAASGEGLVTNVIGYPLATLVNDTLTQLVPKVKDQRNNFVMQMICDLARGDRTQEDVNAQLGQNGIGSADIPQKGSPLSLLVNGDRPRQQQTCLAYIATTLLYPPDNGFLFSQKDGNSKPVIDQQQAAREFAIRMAIAEATAQFYAVVAQNLSSAQGLSFARYRQQVADIALQYAPVYFQSIKIHFNQRAGEQVQINRLDNRNYAVSDSSGREIAYSNGVFSYKRQGVDWLSGGYILGRLYMVDVAAFAMTPVKETGKGKKGKGKK